MKRGKKGQFYLVAAIIIAIAIFGLVSVSNYALTEKKDTAVFEAGKELNIETGKVADYAIVNKKDTARMIGNWTETYVLASEAEDVDSWVFIYGNRTKSTMLILSKSGTGEVSLSSGGNSFRILTTKTTSQEKEFGQDKIDIKVGNETFNFELGDEQEFLFLIKKGGYIKQNE